MPMRCELARDTPVVEVDRDEQLAEGAGIDEAQLALVLEADHGRGCAARAAEASATKIAQLTAHAQVPDEHSAVVEIDERGTCRAGRSPTERRPTSNGDELGRVLAPHRPPAT